MAIDYTRHGPKKMSRPEYDRRFPGGHRAGYNGPPLAHQAGKGKPKEAAALSESEKAAAEHDADQMPDDHLDALRNAAKGGWSYNGMSDDHDAMRMLEHRGHVKSTLAKSGQRHVSITPKGKHALRHAGFEPGM